MHPSEIIVANRERSLAFWNAEEERAYYFPQGWYEHFTVTNGDWLSEGWDANEIYGYVGNEELWVSVHDLAKLEEVDLPTAQARDSKLKTYLDSLNT